VSLDGIDGRMRWTNWSRIAEGGVYSAVRVAQQVGGGAAIAFVTDGQEAPPVSASRPLMADINDARIRGWLIGVGGDQPAAIPKTDANGNRIGYWQADDVIQAPPTPGSTAPAQTQTHEELSELRGEYLASVAGQTGLDYRRLLNVTSFGDALLDAHFARREPVPTDLRWCPALLALLLLVARFMPDAVLAWPSAWRKRIRTIVSLVAPAFNGRPRRAD
jgi:mxaL protein